MLVHSAPSYLFLWAGSRRLAYLSVRAVLRGSKGFCSHLTPAVLCCISGMVYLTSNPADKEALVTPLCRSVAVVAVTMLLCQ